ncbi:MAG: hypothetical protein LBJ09_02475 [Clostridiales bacterium]|nr:hypothetical protein [Clostridiales bacterium]
MLDEAIKNVYIIPFGDFNGELFPNFFDEVSKNDNLRFLIKYNDVMPNNFILKSEIQNWMCAVKIDVCDEYLSFDYLSFLYAKKYIDLLRELRKKAKIEYLNYLTEEIIKTSKKYGVLTEETALVLTYGTSNSDILTSVEFSAPVKDEVLSKVSNKIFVREDISFILHENLKHSEINEIVDTIIISQNDDGSFTDENVLEQKFVKTTSLSIISLLLSNSKKYKKNIILGIDYLVNIFCDENLCKELLFAFDLCIKNNILNKRRSDKIFYLVGKMTGVTAKSLIENFESVEILFEKIKNFEETIISLNKILILFYVRENLLI